MSASSSRGGFIVKVWWNDGWPGMEVRLMSEEVVQSWTLGSLMGEGERLADIGIGFVMTRLGRLR